MRDNHEYIINCEDCNYDTKSFSAFKQHAQAKGHLYYVLTDEQDNKLETDKVDLS